LATGVCPKGRKHIGGGEAPVYEKYQIHSPSGAAEIEESLYSRPKTSPQEKIVSRGIY